MNVIELHAALGALIEQGHGGLTVVHWVWSRGDLEFDEITGADVLPNGDRILTGPLVHLE